ncbi:hypothetical protein F3Y22_tig00111238pilonHSYRG00009 [Hibiscus syriacus]|uniref:HhH-GPD domain-containing protein n=1 Tax=Hibiscus syriacus TaxID=106335 RepID=A0A6A2YSU5_HIBSY|nr:hypothetical protein F3Y22_tig00111238pilonHSYRG00009 [Hibiscus syriacus]
MPEYRVYVRKRKRKEQCFSVSVIPKEPTFPDQCCSVSGITKEPTFPTRPEIKEVLFDQCCVVSVIPKEPTFPREEQYCSVSNEKNDVLFDPCMVLSDKEEEQSSENLSLGSVAKLDLKISLDSPVTAGLLNDCDQKEKCSAPDLHLKVHNFDGIKDLCLESTVTSNKKEVSFNAIEETISGHGCDDGLNPPSTCLVSAGTIEVLNTLDKGFDDRDSVLNHCPFEELSCLFEPKVSQPYAMSQDNGFMRENVSYDQILANDFLNSKKHRKPKRKIQRPKVAHDGKPTTPKQARERKPKFATSKSAKEKKPKLAEQGKEKKSKNVRKQTSFGLKNATIETKNLPSFKSNMIIEINQTKAPTARALDFQLESLDDRPMEFDSLSFPTRKRSKRRKRLNLFILLVKSVRKCVKQRKLFNVNWFSKKRRIQMKRPQKVIDVDAKAHDQMDFSAMINGKRKLFNVNWFSRKRRIQRKRPQKLELTPTPVTDVDAKTHDKMDLSAMINGKRKHRARTLKATLKSRGRSGTSIKKKIDLMIHEMQSLHISDNSLVPYQGPFQPLNKRVPKVDLDPETVREWNLLVGIDVDRTKFETSEDKNKWWEKDREVFAGRISSFIARLQPIQGDRSFRKWKGSVLDSVIGVILTQNVTDAASSNAFMSLAAKFPPKPIASESDQSYSQELVRNNMIGYDVEGLQYFVTEPAHERDRDFEEVTNDLIDELEETRMNNDCKGCFHVVSTSPNSDLNGGLVGEETCINTDYGGCLKVIIDTNLAINSTENLNGACVSMVQSQYTKIPKGVRAKIPKLKEHDYLNMGFCKRKSISKKDEIDSKEEEIDWESVRIQYSTGERNNDQMDAVDWEAVKLSDVNELADCIKDRGQHNILAKTIQNLLNRVVSLHNCLDLEWLRNTPPDLAKRYLLEVNGLGLKSVECIRLLSLEQVAFPVDVNVARIVVRLGWVPLKPLPEHLELHRLELYPILDDIQIYLWPRLCKLPQRILYKLHYHMITFGKVTCTKIKPNCNACPMRDHCKHFQSQYASAKKTLPCNKMKSSSVSASSPRALDDFLSTPEFIQLLDIEDLNKIYEPIIEEPLFDSESQTKIYEPIIEEPFEVPSTIFTESQNSKFDEAEIEYDSDGIHMIKLNIKDLEENNLMFEGGTVSNALIALNSKAALTTAPKLKQNRRLRTEHMVYELPRNHVLLQGLDQTESEHDCQYHLAIWRSVPQGLSFVMKKHALRVVILGNKMPT